MLTDQVLDEARGMSAESIASALHLARMESGLSQKRVVEAATLLNCRFSASTLSNWETGKNLPNASHLQTLGRVYGTRFVLGESRIVSLDSDAWELVRRVLGVAGTPSDTGSASIAGSGRVGAALRALIEAVAHEELRSEPSIGLRDAVGLLQLSEAADLENLPLIVVNEDESPRYPSFQFDFAERCIRPAVASVNELLDAANDSAAVLSWWSSANGRLPDNQSPRDLLDSDDAMRVVALAKSLIADVG